MKRLYYENQGVNTYLVYKVNESDGLDTMSLGMLTNNKIPGLAQTIYSQQDEDRFIKFNVSAKISVSQFLTGSINKKRILGVFNGIVTAMLSAEDYMLDSKKVLLDLNYIFVDVSTCDTVLICLPADHAKIPEVELKNFLKSVMFSTQFDQVENCDYVAKIINHLNGTETFNLVDFKKLLNELEINPQETISAPKKAASPVMPESVSIVEKKEENPPIPMPYMVEEPVMPMEMEYPVEQEEPGISLFYLLQHYNKDNAAMYKAQKEARKLREKEEKQNKKAMKKEKKKKKKGRNEEEWAFGTVPGSQENEMNFAIPGQEMDEKGEGASEYHFSPHAMEEMAPTPQKNEFVFQMSTESSADYGETTVLYDGIYGETTVLNQDQTQMVTPSLMRTKNNEKIIINKPIFRIGKERSYVDYFIGDNTAISRSHANIVFREHKYYVVDTNSTNHTYVNGQMLQSNLEFEVKHGDKIRLANEDFEFQLY